MALSDVSIPDGEMNEFDLPRVCVVTGAQDGVVFKKVQFQWYPPWIGVTVLCSPIIFAIIALIMMKRSKGELPFTEEAWSAWQRGKIVFGLSVFGAFVLFFGGIFLIDTSGALAAVVMLSSIVLPIVIGVTMLRGRGPRVASIKDGRTNLKIPSADAAARITQHLSAGARQPRPQGVA